MSGLMVSREGRFLDCRVTGVEEDLPGVSFVVSFSAESAAWFDPGATGAGPDGWLRDITAVQAEMRLILADPERHGEALARARRWMDEQVVLTGFADLEQQATGLYRANPRGPEDVLACRMDPASMDRPEA